MPGLILIVEDEPDLNHAIDYSVRKEGYQTRRALTGAEALEQAFLEPVPDLVLLDLMLPDMSGTEVCRRIKADDRTAHVPVIMVTAKGEEIDRVVGFEVGADDYVVKPFSTRELVLRMRAILRRSQAGPAEVEEEEHVRFGNLKLDKAAHRTWVEGEEITLTALEFRLLTTLLDRKGRVQTRDRLLSDVWGVQAAVTTRTVDTHVKRLRQKLGAAGNYVETIRGVGYRFTSSPQASD